MVYRGKADFVEGTGFTVVYPANKCNVVGGASDNPSDLAVSSHFVTAGQVLDHIADRCSRLYKIYTSPCRQGAETCSSSTRSLYLSPPTVQESAATL